MADLSAMVKPKWSQDRLPLAEMRLGDWFDLPDSPRCASVAVSKLSSGGERRYAVFSVTDGSRVFLVDEERPA